MDIRHTWQLLVDCLQEKGTCSARPAVMPSQILIYMGAQVRLAKQYIPTVGWTKTEDAKGQPSSTNQFQANTIKKEV